MADPIILHETDTYTVTETLFKTIPLSPYPDGVPGFVYFAIHVRRDYFEDVFNHLRVLPFIADVDYYKHGVTEMSQTNPSTRTMIVAVSPRFEFEPHSMGYVIHRIVDEAINEVKNGKKEEPKTD